MAITELLNVLALRSVYPKSILDLSRAQTEADYGSTNVQTQVSNQHVRGKKTQISKFKEKLSVAEQFLQSIHQHAQSQ